MSADVKTPAGRAALRAVCEAATPGPWVTEETPRLGGSVNALLDGLWRQVAEASGQAAMFDTRATTGEIQQANARFMALARTALPEAIEYIERLEAQVSRRGEPVPMVLACPTCGEPHVDEGEWETRPHRTHLCLQCKTEFRPANIYTVGVAHLPENQYSAPRRQDPRDARIKRLEQALRETREFLSVRAPEAATAMARIDTALGKDGVL